MGAWGVGHFENDTALDWVHTLDEGEVEVLRAALDVQGEDLDADVCSEALAAAEVVAAARGAPGSELPDEVHAWLERHGRALGAQDAARAHALVERIGQRSELQELFDEGGRDAEWHAAVDGLVQRLRRVAG